MKLTFLKIKITLVAVSAFSLVEMLVVLGLFSSIATLSLGALFNAQSINAHLQETQSILDNINLSIQTITRDIRFGSEFYGTSTIPTNPSLVPVVRRNCEFGNGTNLGCGVLIFKSADAVDDLDRTAIYVSNGVLYKTDFPRGGIPVTLQMTTSDIIISTSSLVFYVEGAQTSGGTNDENGAIDYKQPLVTFLISGRTKPSKSSNPSVSFSLQTQVSAREPDNK